MATDQYETMVYSPGWYYRKWPGFYNEQCYVVLSDYSHHLEKYVRMTVEGVEECKNTDTVMEEDPNTTVPLVCLSTCTLDHIHRPNKKSKTTL